MTARAGHPVSRAVRRAIAARRDARAGWVTRAALWRYQMRYVSDDAPERVGCECCGRQVTVSNDARERGTFLSADCGGGVVVACVDCARLGYGSDPMLVDPPYLPGGLAGPLSGPRGVLP